MTTTLLESLIGEIAEAAELLRPHYPNDSDQSLRSRARDWLGFRYARGRWPTNAELLARQLAPPRINSF